jgi:hypothetical protein
VNNNEEIKNEVDNFTNYEDKEAFKEEEYDFDD